MNAQFFFSSYAFWPRFKHQDEHNNHNISIVISVLWMRILSKGLIVVVVAIEYLFALESPFYIVILKNWIVIVIFCVFFFRFFIIKMWMQIMSSIQLSMKKPSMIDCSQAMTQGIMYIVCVCLY